ncbi:MAG: SAM-dependent methyltransferase, partial [Burkholderiaceae bacterium]
MTATRARAAADAAPPLIAIALISGAALAYEIVLMRLFSIILWHHFAYMIISLALLGYGASGALLSLAQGAVQRRFLPLFCAAAAAFGVSAIGSFALAQRVPFNPLEMLWDARQPAYLLCLYLLLALPFLCAGACVCMAFSRWRGMAPRIYSFDILGAGLGSLAVMGALFVLAPHDALRLIGALGFAAAALAWLECSGPRRWPALALGVMAVLPVLLPQVWLAPEMSPYKELSQTLRIPEARVIAQSHSPLGLVSVVESTRTPLRHAPGLSLNATVEPPPQLGVFIDGDGPSALSRFDGRRDSLAYLDQMTSALPYHLLRQPRVLVLGAGAGADVLQAHYHGARRIDAVELNPQVIDLVRRRFADYAGGLYSGGVDAGLVRVHVAEARGFVAASRERYDLIHVALLDSFSASAAGLYALAENYLYTVQALEDDLRHLEPGGLLAITRWVSLPPRDALKLFGAVVAALQRSGVADPASRLALVRSWQTYTLLVKNGALSAEDVAKIRAFCAARSFDVAFYPGIKAQEANRYNVVAPPDLFDAVSALLGPGRDQFVQNYKFHIAPATDDQPHFFHFFKW